MSSSIAVFVLLGSLALVIAFKQNFDREERRSFEELARANVGFLKRCARLGEPFFLEKEGGMGLGLAVAKDICEAHGGSLTVENRDGGGARVRAEFAKNPNSGAREEDVNH